MDDNFPTEQLISNDEHFKKIYFISKEVSDFLYTDVFRHDLNLINLGVQVFQRNNSKFSAGECIYRVSQDGIMNMVPYFSKRVIRTKNLELFKKLIIQRYNNISMERLEDQDFFNQVDALTTGCFVFIIELEDGNVEALSMHKFEHALSTMVGKEGAISL